MKIDWAGLSVGARVVPLEQMIEREQLIRYAGASGDFNRIHYDDPFAKEGGYPSVIAHGMLSMGLLGRMLTAWAGPSAVRKLSVRFKAITFPGDRISCAGEVIEKREEQGVRWIDLRIWCEKADGTVTVDGKATVVV